MEDGRRGMNNPNKPPRKELILDKERSWHYDLDLPDYKIQESRIVSTFWSKQSQVNHDNHKQRQKNREQDAKDPALQVA